MKKDVFYFYPSRNIVPNYINRLPFTHGDCESGLARVKVENDQKKWVFTCRDCGWNAMLGKKMDAGEFQESVTGSKKFVIGTKARNLIQFVPLNEEQSKIEYGAEAHRASS